MKLREKTELALIPLAVAAVAFLGHALPDRLGTGSLLVIACLAWLVQGGVRDLWILYQLKTAPSTAPRRKLACMCLESSAGMAGIILGLVLALSGVGGEVALSPARWAGLAALVFAAGFLLKDFVITWRPLGLRRDPEHHSIVFTWR